MRSEMTTRLPRQAAITGLGIISCIGTSLGQVSESLRAGRSGIALDQERRQRGFRSALTGVISGFDSDRWKMSRKMLRTMDETVCYAYAATMDAIDNACLRTEELANDRCGIVFGNDSCVKAAVEAVDIARTDGSTRGIGSGHIFRAMNSTVTMNLASVLGLGGAAWTLSAACASGAHALGQALLLIQGGQQDIILAGGAQEVNWESMASFDALGAFSTREDDPEKACRPFDADRDGLVPSGGAACLLVEELEHARARGARVYAILRGYGFSCDGSEHLSQPNVRGAIVAMRRALNDAEVEPHEVDYVNAHATSTPVGDLAEAKAIAEVLGLSVSVSSTKSMTGHECWMAGASETLYTILMAQHGFLAPNINFVKFEEGFPRINVVKETTAAPIGIALSNSFGFGGTNAALVLDFHGAA